MKKATMTIAAMTLSSAVGFAKPIAKMELLCVADQPQETVRTVYVTEDKTPLLADPVGSLLVVESVKQPDANTFALTAATDTGSEVLIIKNTGDATLTISNNGVNTNLVMKCYSNGVMQGLVL
jgi:hypothetical protein